MTEKAVPSFFQMYILWKIGSYLRQLYIYIYILFDVFTVFKKYTKYRIMLKIVKYDLKKCIKNTIMIKYDKILRNKLFMKPRSVKLM